MVRRVFTAAILILAAAGCGSKTYPAELVDAEAMTKSHVAASAMKLAPSIWKKGTEALEKSRSLAKKGKAVESKLAGLEALIHFKTAVAVAEEKIAKDRLRQAQEGAAQYAAQEEKFRVLRQDAEARFLQIMSYHMAQKDEAAQRKSSFESERAKYLELDKKEKKSWDEAQRPILEKTLHHVRSLIAAADLVASRFGDLPSQRQEAESAAAEAEKALGGSWETARPLVDEALMKAERLLEHERIMAKPSALKNPATLEETLAMVKKNLEGKGAFVSATFTGILVSVENPWEGASAKLGSQAAGAVAEVARLLEGRENALTLVAAYHFGKEPATASEAIALTAQANLEKGKLPAGSIAALSWGDATPFDAGPCLASACPGGRLDIFVVNY